MSSREPWTNDPVVIFPIIPTLPLLVTLYGNGKEKYCPLNRKRNSVPQFIVPGRRKGKDSMNKMHCCIELVFKEQRSSCCHRFPSARTNANMALNLVLLIDFLVTIMSQRLLQLTVIF